MRKATLYKKDSRGGIRIWTIWTSGNTIYTEHGKLDGAKQTASKKAYGKNLNKANETTDEEQADLEAQSMFAKQLDKGYKASLDKTASPDSLRLAPMLAHKWEPKKKKLAYPIDIQPKLDGVRCLAYWKDGKVVLASRGGKTYDVPHVSQELQRLKLPKSIVLDGELYIHGIPFQSFISLAKRNRPESIALRYCVYDCVRIRSLDDIWLVRKDRLNRLFVGPLAEAKYSVLVPTFSVGSDEGVRAVQSELVAAGYEGAILRTHEGKYRLGYRSRDLLKVKSFDDDEFEIIGYTEGKGKAKGSVVWVCETAHGKKFQVVPKGTYEKRREWFVNGDTYIGDMLTVKYFGKSEAGIPRFPVGIGIRDEDT
jgi:DNA ligase 1